MSRRDERRATYAAAGVDIGAADRTVKEYRDIARRTDRPEVLSGIGSFAGLFRLGEYGDPVIVSSADGVGTKVLVAAAMGRFDSVGRDLVNHCVNDILTVGAEPLFFLDYLATADLSQEHRIEVVNGVGLACEENGVSLIGGETADMPDVYRSGTLDLAGVIVGVVEHDSLIDGSRLVAGDMLIALPSSGLQTNGYSLVRDIWDISKGQGGTHDQDVLSTGYDELGGTLGDALLEVHGSFLNTLRPVLPGIHSMAHITGGGIVGNLSRVIPDELTAELDRTSWETPPLFDLIQRTGDVDDKEMMSTFNMGVGMVIAVAAEDVDSMLGELSGAWLIGELSGRVEGAPAVQGLDI